MHKGDAIRLVDFLLLEFGSISSRRQAKMAAKNGRVTVDGICMTNANLKLEASDDNVEVVLSAASVEHQDSEDAATAARDSVELQSRGAKIIYNEYQDREDTAGAVVIAFKPSGLKLRGDIVPMGYFAKERSGKDDTLEALVQRSTGLCICIDPLHALPKAASGLVLLRARTSNANPEEFIQPVSEEVQKSIVADPRQCPWCKEGTYVR